MIDARSQHSASLRRATMLLRTFSAAVLFVVASLVVLAPSGTAHADGYCGSSAKQTGVVKVWGTVSYHVWCVPHGFAKTCPAGQKHGTSAQWKYGWIGNGMNQYLVYTLNGKCVYSGNSVIRDLKNEFPLIASAIDSACGNRVLQGALVSTSWAPKLSWQVRVITATTGTVCYVNSL